MERPALVIHSSWIQGMFTVILSHLAWTERNVAPSCWLSTKLEEIQLYKKVHLLNRGGI